MKQGQRKRGYEEVLEVFPLELRGWAEALSDQEQREAEELRLRVGWPMTVVLPQGEKELGGGAIQQSHLNQVVELASRASVHTVMDQIRRGYLTIQGGHRIGLGGSAVLREGTLHSFSRLSSLSIRIARERKGMLSTLGDKLIHGGRLCSTLLLAPPGAGKTTLLRDCIRAASNGEGMQAHRVGLADERGEVAALWQGRPQMDVGRHTDVVEGCPKAQGMMLLLRGMNPQILASDEITDPEDISALLSAAGCGVTLLATAHGTGLEDMQKRPLYRTLLQAQLFQRLVSIQVEARGRSYQVEALS